MLLNLEKFQKMNWIGVLQAFSKDMELVSPILHPNKCSTTRPKKHLALM